MITQLKPCLNSLTDSYQQPHPDEPLFIFVEGNMKSWKSFEIEHLINKQSFWREREQALQYLIRWKGYEPQYDQWLDVKELGNTFDLVTNYETLITSVQDLPDRIVLLMTSSEEQWWLIKQSNQTKWTNNDKSLVIYSKTTSSNLSDVLKNALPIMTTMSHMILKSKPINLSSSVTALNTTTDTTVSIKNTLVQASCMILMTLKVMISRLADTLTTSLTSKSTINTAIGLKHTLSRIDTPVLWWSLRTLNTLLKPMSNITLSMPTTTLIPTSTSMKLMLWW